ncbi:MAG: FtsX-like permease family protein, partial [Planctomycetota bacterium]|nr:FtsX-like permease family protein [Planctomycetota bacterium]
RSLTRAGGAASALGSALAMTVGVIVMVYSFELEVRHWIQTAIRADVFIGEAHEETSRENARVPDEAVKLIAATPGVRAIDTLRAVEVPRGDRSFRFAGAELPTPESRARFEFLEGEADAALDAALAGDAVVSEPLARHYGLHPGDTLEVPSRAPGGTTRFVVRGVFRDFSYDRGYALTGKDAFVAAFGDTGVSNVAAYVEPGADREAVAERLREAFRGKYLLNVRSNADLRAGVIDVFERTFAVTYLLQIIATVMALAGTAVTLFGLFLERAREIATLRALGATIGAIGRLFAAESLLMTLFPVAMALPLGAMLAWVLIHVVNLRSFGWTIGYAWPWGPVLITCALAACASILATLVPLALARRQSISGALREE